jgi:DNA-binding protein H-NS
MKREREERIRQKISSLQSILSVIKSIGIDNDELAKEQTVPYTEKGQEAEQVCKVNQIYFTVQLRLQNISICGIYFQQLYYTIKAI